MITPSQICLLPCNLFAMLNDMSAVRDLPYGTHLCSTECMKKLKTHFKTYRFKGALMSSFLFTFHPFIH